MPISGSIGGVYDNPVQENLRRTLEDSVKPWNDYSSAMTQLAMANRQRGYQLEDLASARQEERDREDRQYSYHEREADAANKRQVSAYKEEERLRAINEALKDRVPGVTADMSVEEIAKARSAFAKQSAKATLDFQYAQRKHLDSKYDAAQDAAAAVATQTGTVQQKKQALLTMLNDPAARQIPKEKANELRNVLANATSTEQIDKAVNSTIDYMQKDYWFSSGKAYDRANAIFNTYTTALKPLVDQDKQVGLTLALDNLHKVGQEREDLDKAMWAHGQANAGLLDPEDRKALLGTLGSTGKVDPIAVMPGKSRGDYGGEEGQGQTTPELPSATSTSPPPAPAASGASFIPPVSEAGIIPTLTNPALPAAIAQKVATSRAGQVIGNLPTAAGALVGMGGDVLFGRDRPGNQGQVVPPPSQADVVANRQSVNSQMANNGLPLKATPEEEQAVQQLMSKLDPSITPDRIQAGAAAIKAGDPKAISTWNSLLKMVRAKSMGVPAPVTTTPDPSAPVGSTVVPTYPAGIVDYPSPFPVK